MNELKIELSELLQRHDFLSAALLAGRIQDSKFDQKKYQEIIMELAAKVWHRCNSKRDPLIKADCISYVLFDEFGLEGKTDRYKQVIDDPNRYYLHKLLDNKQGAPLTYAVLFSILAEQVGLEHECIALPSYHLIKLTDPSIECYIDPFDRGNFLTEEEFQKKFRSNMQRHRILSTSLYEKINSEQMVARLIHQLKHIYILKGKAIEALRTVELLTTFFPNSPELTRDRGILYCEMEYFTKAMEDLKYYLKRRPQAEDVGEIKKLTSMLKGYRVVMN